MTSLFHAVPFDWKKPAPTFAWRNLAEYMTGTIFIYSAAHLATLRTLRKPVNVTPLAGNITYRDYWGLDPRHYLVTPGAYSDPVQYLYVAALTNLSDIIRQPRQAGTSVTDPDTLEISYVPGSYFWSATVEFLLDEDVATVYDPLDPPTPLNPLP